MCCFRREAGRRMPSPGCYDISSAGHIPAGDGFVESALRELEEELGIRAEPSELVRIGLCDTRVDTEFHGCPFRNREISCCICL